MTARTLHGITLLLSIPLLAVLSGVSLAMIGRFHKPEIHAWAMALATSLPHALLGWFLWRKNSGAEGSGIGSGLSILGVRFLFGAGAFVTGIVNCPGQERLFAPLWTGIFLILLASESLFFVQGVQEL